MWRLASWLRKRGVLTPLRVSEQQLYETPCDMRDAEVGATSAHHILEALHFLDSAAQLTLINLYVVVSGRCRGVARDLYLTKSPLSQKSPLLVSQVKLLEQRIQTDNDICACVIGQLLFCIHSCCRWKDSQRLKDLRIEHGRSESILHADALSSKTALTLEAKTKFLPYVAIGTGIATQDGWKQGTTNVFGVGTLLYPVILSGSLIGQTAP